eukprot:4552446-Amphidinium_carterae.1
MELAEQLCTVVMSLTDGESFDLVVGAGAGVEQKVWRRLHRRWDPLATGRVRGLLRKSSRLVARSLLNCKVLSSA